MLIAHRREVIKSQLHRTGQVTVVDLSRELQVSEDTIRRDLEELDRQGDLKRVHGGAVLTSPAMGNFHQRENLSIQEKQRIGRFAATLIQEGQVVLVDGGTTTREMVRALPINLQATIITHSPTIACELQDHNSIEVILLGGRLFKHSMVALGDGTVNELRKIHADLCFLGATGIHPLAGATTGDWEEASVKRQMCDSATDTYLLTSPEKLHAVSPYQIIPTQNLRGLIVLAETPHQQLIEFQRGGLELLMAP